MSTLATVRGALHTVLSTALTGANVYRYESGHVEYPAVTVGLPDEVDALPYYGPADLTVTIPVRLEVAASRDWTQADAALEALMASVTTAVNAAPSLGGQVDSAVLRGFGGFGYRQVGADGALTVLTCEARVEVFG